MRAIDVHAHIIVRESLEAMSDAYPEQGPRLIEDGSKFFIVYSGRERLGPIPLEMFDIDARLDVMDRQRIDLQVLAVPPPNFYYHVAPEVGAAFARIQNDAMLQLSDRFPDRFHVFATLPLQDVSLAIGELERVAGHPRIRGVELSSNIGGVNLDAPELERLWAALEERDLPAWVHPDQRAIAGADRMNTYYMQNLIGIPLETTLAVASLILSGVVERHPRLRFGFVHGGGFAPYQIGRWDHGWSCRSETRSVISEPPRRYFDQLYFDTITHDPASLEMLGGRSNWSRVVLGSDFPFDMASPDPIAAVEELGLSSEDEDAVLQRNAEKLMRPVAETVTQSARRPSASSD